MRASILRNGEMVVDDLPDLTPGPGQVLVEPIACGICGSDLHAVHHAHELVASAKAAGGGFPEHLNPDADVVLGHELSCRVLDVGSDIRGIEPGAEFAAMPFVKSPSGHYATIGWDNLFPGGYASQLLLSPAALVPIPNGLDPAIAALTEPMAVGLHAVNESAVGDGRIAVVVGAGPVGLAIVAALAATGVEVIIASDFSAARRATASDMGAHVVVDPATEDPFDAWRAAGDGTTPPVVFEAVGVPGMIDQLMETAPARTEIVVAGVCIPPDTFHPTFGIYKELRLTFALGWSPAEFRDSLANLAEGRIDGRRIVTGEVGIDDVPQAFADLASPDHHVKILVRPDL